MRVFSKDIRIRVISAPFARFPMFTLKPLDLERAIKGEQVTRIEIECLTSRFSKMYRGFGGGSPQGSGGPITDAVIRYVTIGQQQQCQWNPMFIQIR